MSRKSPSKKGAAAAAANTAEAETAELAAYNTPQAERQRLWTKRAEETAQVIQEVQQLLERHTATAEEAAEALNQLTHTASQLWSLELDRLPLRYTEKSRQTPQRTGSAAGSRVDSGGKAGSRPFSGRLQRPGSAASKGSDKGATSAPETIASAIQRLTPEQRLKVSAALQKLFFATPAPAAETEQQPTAAATPPPPLVPSTPAPPPQAAAPSSVGNQHAGNKEPLSPAENSAQRSREGGIPAPLVEAMKELQEKRTQLNVQRTTAANAAAQQQKRLELLQEAAMVAQYALKAPKSDLKIQP